MKSAERWLSFPPDRRDSKARYRIRLAGRPWPAQQRPHKTPVRPWTGHH